jgi:hypothetical protein
MPESDKQITTTLKDDADGSSLKVVIHFDKGSGISISFPDIHQANEDNPVQELFLDFFNGQLSILIYCQNDEDNPKKIPICTHAKDEPNEIRTDE